MLITFLNVSLRAQTWEKSWRVNFWLGAEARNFCHVFYQKGICIFTAECWEKVSGLHGNRWLMALCVCVWPGSLFSPLWRFPIEFRASILQMMIEYLPLMRKRHFYWDTCQYLVQSRNKLWKWRKEKEETCRALLSQEVLCFPPFKMLCAQWKRHVLVKALSPGSVLQVFNGPGQWFVCVRWCWAALEL